MVLSNPGQSSRTLGSVEDIRVLPSAAAFPGTLDTRPHTNYSRHTNIPIGILKMRVSLKATYGIMAALDLALNNGGAPVQAKSIARRQGIPARFLEQVLLAMKKAGLVESTRGAQGGYLLSRDPQAVSLAEIVAALDDSLTPRHSNGEGGRRSGKLEKVLSHVWERVRQAELEVLGAVTLQELMAKHQQLEAERVLMYHI
jgi:Rrf2 family cysteine metabolism transcriptional repressor